MRYKNINNIVCFDFDQTLVQTFEPEYGVSQWEEVKGMPYPHKGWWARPESLDMEVFDIQKNDWVYDQWKEAREMEDTLVIMMTGRIKKLEPHVKAILEKHGMEFDRYYFNFGGTTLSFKIKVFESLLDEFKNTEDLTMYDDRVEHIGPFMRWGEMIKKTKGIKVNVIQVL